MNCEWKLAQGNLFLNNANLGGAGTTYSNVSLIRNIINADIYPLEIRKVYYMEQAAGTNTTTPIYGASRLTFLLNTGIPPTTLENELLVTLTGSGGSSFIFQSVRFAIANDYANRVEFSSPIRNVTSLSLIRYETSWQSAISASDQLNILFTFEYRFMI